ncbi:hypothetical protein GQ600_9247 [Phytophthora cactorum]|nr:hypothetical protein GQ600_9247 [Phytophthora cactorum]
MAAMQQPLMLLVLFLHPRHVRVAVAIHKESPRLRFLERLCGYGICYCRRYVGADNESDIERLSAALHAWHRGGFGDVGQYWSFVCDIRADLKLPKLAAILLSIAVNTTTGERYFSEPAAIEKARKVSLIRERRKRCVELKRIVAAAAREHENQVIVHQEISSEDTTEYWQDIFNVLDGDELMSEELPITEDDERKTKVFKGFEGSQNQIRQSFPDQCEDVSTGNQADRNSWTKRSLLFFPRRALLD